MDQSGVRKKSSCRSNCQGLRRYFGFSLQLGHGLPIAIMWFFLYGARGCSALWMGCALPRSGGHGKVQSPEVRWSPVPFRNPARWWLPVISSKKYVNINFFKQFSLFTYILIKALQPPLDTCALQHTGWSGLFVFQNRSCRYLITNPHSSSKARKANKVGGCSVWPAGPWPQVEETHCGKTSHSLLKMW